MYTYLCDPVRSLWHRSPSLIFDSLGTEVAVKVPKDEPANQTKILQLFRGEAQALSCVPLSASVLFTSSLLCRLTLSDTGSFRP